MKVKIWKIKIIEISFSALSLKPNCNDYIHIFLMVEDNYLGKIYLILAVGSHNCRATINVSLFFFKIQQLKYSVRTTALQLKFKWQKLKN